jgi:TatD DNase family protein
MVREAAQSGVLGVLHCFTGPSTLADLAIDTGWYVSFSGIVTFPRFTNDALMRAIPEERVLVESDSPYLAPVPHRGKRNEPAWVTFTVARVAAARGSTADALARITARNAQRLFGLTASDDAAAAGG